MKNELIARYQQVQQRIEKACESAQRQGQVQLLAVSKTKPLEDILTLARETEQRAFGENYLQEGLEKIDAAKNQFDGELEWHFIGPIQSNKTRPIAEHFDWVHSVDRLKIARRFSEQRPNDLPPLQILLEVNVSGEATKAGITPEALMDVAAEVVSLPNLTLRGLMAIPARADSLEAQRQPFIQMQQLLKQLQQTYPDLPLDTLSMGMSADLEAAIMEGATIVRIGTDIFGARDYSNKA